MRLSSETLVMRTSDPDAKRLGQRILIDGERLLRMVDNLLDTTRIEEGKLELKKEPLSLQDVVQAIDIQIQVAADLSIVADCTSLETVLRNLMDNAIKACAAGNGTYVEVSGKRLGHFIQFSVEDDGLGFPPEDAAIIFEKFYRLGDELRRSTPGTGLGLYIVRQLVTLSGAQIKAESERPGKGATIKVIWPIAEMA